MQKNTNEFKLYESKLNNTNIGFTLIKEYNQFNELFF